MVFRLLMKEQQFPLLLDRESRKHVITAAVVPQHHALGAKLGYNCLEFTPLGSFGMVVVIQKSNHRLIFLGILMDLTVEILSGTLTGFEPGI
jgi:hypothetical protein